ncbi:hypothetical protein [Mesorhizobium sp. M1329]|uniref:hypothetical protein n=1 Tax=Mesorhizobium sp. M1329 TaxID=2957083 RepID=UPI00333BFF4F
MAHPIERRIAERQAQLEDIDAQIKGLEMSRHALKAEIAAYRDALQYLNPQSSGARTRRASASRERGISVQWAQLLSLASDEGTSEFGIDDIVMAGDIIGHPDMKRPSVRTQAANMVTRGVLERVTPGTFRVTESGKKEIAESLPPNENGEASAPPDVEQDSRPVQTPNPTGAVFD